MSWTILKTDNNASGIKDLQTAIKLALENKILMFGAASDQGSNDNPDLIFPLASGSIFCIGAAKTSGQAEDSSERDSHYVFPGTTLEIMSRMRSRSKDPQGSAEMLLSSSCATALAAGLTALILHCVEITETKRFKNRPPHHSPTPETGSKTESKTRKDLTTHKTMKSIFDKMVVDENKKYIAVKNFFEARFEDLDWEPYGEGELEKAMTKIIRYD